MDTENFKHFLLMMILLGFMQSACKPFGKSFFPTEHLDKNSSAPASDNTDEKVSKENSPPTEEVLDLIDDDSSSKGFGGGQMSNVVWDNSNSRLRLLAAENKQEMMELHESWTPQWNKLISYWKFNGDCKDSISTNDCVVRNGASFVSSGKINGAANFDGVDDAMDVVSPSGLPVGSSERSFCGWAKWAAGHSGGTLITQNVSAGQHFIYQHSFSAGYYFFTDGVNAPNNQTTSYSLYTVDDWSFFCFTLSTNTFRYYINSNLIASGTFSVSINTGPMSTLVFGTRYDVGGSAFKGQLDEISIWSTALTQSEVRQIYERQRYAYSGLFTSRVINLLGNNPIGVSWKTTLPSFKELIGDSDQSGSISSKDYESSSDYSSLVGSNGLTSDNNLQQGLFALWNFNGNYGALTDGEQILDQSGNGWHLSVVDPDATNTISYVTGVLGQGIRLDGTNDYLLGSTSFNFTDQISFAFWIYPEAGQLSNATVFSKHSTGTNGFSYELFTATVDHYQFGWGNGVSWTCSSLLSETMQLTNSKWQHVAITKLGSERRLYLNGIDVQNCTGSWSTISTSVDAFMIGRWSSGGGRFFKGTLDEMAFWNRRLHASEVQQLYLRGATRIGIQTTTCSKSDCSDASSSSWKGPSNDATTSFTERNYNTALDTSGNPTGEWYAVFPSLLWKNFNLFSLTKNPYFRYRVFFESMDTSTSCLLGSTNSFCSSELKYIEVLKN